MFKGRKLFARIVLVVMILFSASFFTLLNQHPVSAESSSSTFCQCENTYSDGSVVTEQGSDAMIFGDKNGCYCAGPKGVIRIGIGVFTGLLAVAGTLGIIFAGVLYLTARDNEEQVVKAKKRIINVIIGIVSFGLLDVLAYFILPTGLNDDQPYVVSSVSTRIDRPVEKPATPAKKNSYSQMVETPTTKPKTTHTYKKKDDDKKATKNTTCKNGAKPAKAVTYRRQFDNNGLIQWKGGSSKCSTNSKWKYNHNIGCSACPMISALNAISQVTGCAYTQQIFADTMKAYTKNFTSPGSLFGTSQGKWSNTGYPIVEYYARKYGVHYTNFGKGSKAKQKALDALKKGRPVSVSGKGDKIYGYGGHWVLFAEYNESTNKVRIINSAKNGFSKWVDWATATKHAKRYIQIWK